MALLRRYLSRWLAPILHILYRYLSHIISNLGYFFGILCGSSSEKEEKRQLPPISVGLMEMPLWLDIGLSERLTSTLRPLRSVVTEVLCSLCDLIVALHDLQEYILLVIDENGQRKLQPFIDNMMYFSMSWISAACDPSSVSGKLTVMDIVAGCRPPAPVLPDSAYYAILVSPIREEIRQLHASFHPLCHIGVVSPSGSIPTSMRSGDERLVLVDCKHVDEKGSIPPEDVNIRMQLRIEQLKRCMNRLARSCAELDIEFHRSDFLLQYIHNCKQDFRIFGGYAINEIQSLQLEEYQTRNAWTRILQRANSSEAAVFDPDCRQKLVVAMYRVLIYSTTVMRLASIAEFAVGECERAHEFSNPSSGVSSNSHKKAAPQGREEDGAGPGIWPGSKAKSDCFDWAQNVAVRALTGSPIDRAVGDFCVKAVRSMDFPLHPSDDVSDMEGVLGQLFSNEWLDLLLPPGSCRVEYTDYRERGFISRLVGAVGDLRKGVDEALEFAKASGGYPAERRAKNAIHSIWRELTRTQVEGYLQHFGSFVAQYSPVVQKPLSERLNTYG
ncbi:hypothetical protein FOZ62_018649 [Perkinsus olseni]|uniref:Uncharacterized protein n=1 Tax=Perkinsus olseni TaxID=32597 RepID=A0A7J6RD80_PEROL|nr:hypothetical protein FOZ62_018649 [Perkinsus olseni]